MPKRRAMGVTRVHARAALPQYASDGAAGLDLCAVLDTPLTLAPGQRAKVGTGLVVALPEGHEGQVRPRSGLAFKHGVTLVNTPGTIDEDYRGEVGVLLVNLGEAAYTVEHGDRIAQLVVMPVTRVEIDEVQDVDSLGSTDRGDGGFGSTGQR